jgi:hypothetical protein
MSFEKESGFEKKQRPIPTEGLHLAVCYSIVDLGTHMESFQGADPKPSPKVSFNWELPNSKAVFNPEKGEQPMALFQEYTIAAGDKAKLPKMLCSWGKIPALTAISSNLLKAFIGQACMINVVHSPDKQKPEIKYANIGQKGLQVMPLMEGMVRPTGTVNPIMFFNLDTFSWDQYLKLPKFTQEKIAKSQEWSGILVKYPKPAEAVVAAAINGGMQPNSQFSSEAPVVTARPGDVPVF